MSTTMVTEPQPDPQAVVLAAELNGYAAKELRTEVLNLRSENAKLQRALDNETSSKDAIKNSFAIVYETAMVDGVRIGFDRAIAALVDLAKESLSYFVKYHDEVLDLLELFNSPEPSDRFKAVSAIADLARDGKFDERRICQLCQRRFGTCESCETCADCIPLGESCDYCRPSFRAISPEADDDERGRR